MVGLYVYVGAMGPVVAEYEMFLRLKRKWKGGSSGRGVMVYRRGTGDLHDYSSASITMQGE